MAVIVAEKVAFWLARMLAMSPMVGSGIRERLIHFAQLFLPWPDSLRDPFWPCRHAKHSTRAMANALTGKVESMVCATTMPLR